MKDKYFVVSDIHGFTKELKKTLKTAGFKKTCKSHKLVICGDLFDRGSEAVALFKFLTSLDPNNLILVRGNHEDLFEELLEKNYPEGHDFSNCTVDTFVQIAQAEGFNEKFGKFTASQVLESGRHERFSGFYIEDEAQELWDRIKSYVLKSAVYNWLKTAPWRDFYEIGDKYICVHSFIPLKSSDNLPHYYTRNRLYTYSEDWRTTATEQEWAAARWGCPWALYKNGYFSQEEENGKTLICGHWHASDFHANLGNNYGTASELYYSPGIIAIDGGVFVEYPNGYNGKRVLKHLQNVVVIKNNICYDEFGFKLYDMRKTDYEPTYYLAPNTNMADCCYCSADCEKDCARKKTCTGYCTISDFSTVCKDYTKKK